MIGLLIWLLIAVVVMYIVYLIASKFILDTTLRTIALLIIGLIFLLIILNQLGLLGGMGISP